MKNKKIIHSTFFNVGSNILSQIITISFIPLVSRLYGPEQFGEVTLFLGICSCLVAISSFRLAIVIPIAETNKEKQIALVTSLIIILVLTLVLAILFSITDILSVVELNGLYPLIIAYFFFASINNVQVNLVISQGNYRVIGASKMINSIFLNLARLSIAYICLSLGLIYSLIIAELFTFVFLLKATRISYKKIGGNNISKLSDIFNFVSKYRSFPKYQVASQLVLISSQYAPIFVLSTTFTAYEVGLFAMANNLVNLPVNSVGMALSQIYYGEYRKTEYWGKMFKHSLLIILAFLFIATPVIIVMFLFGSDIVGWLLGNDWSGVGDIITLLIFMGAAKLCLAVISQSFNIFRSQKLQLVINSLFFIVSYLSLYLATQLSTEFFDVLLIYTVSCTIMLFFCIFLTLRNIKVNTKNECNILR